MSQVIACPLYSLYVACIDDLLLYDLYLATVSLFEMLMAFSGSYDITSPHYGLFLYSFRVLKF